MAEPFLGQITLLGCNFAPYGWMLCQGQLLAISQYAALFSLLGTNYGGNGTTNFGLPDLRGRMPNGMGQGPGLSPYDLGELGGAEAVSLTQSTVPTHTHTLLVQRGHGANTDLNLYNTGAPSVALAPAQVSIVTGSGVPHNNLQPLLVLNWCIAYQGIFPTRP